MVLGVDGNNGVRLPSVVFIEVLCEETRAARAPLVFDEVLTGFRLARGGEQERYGIEPDLTCLGKGIGGGLPVGCFGGREEGMEEVGPSGPFYQAGTLSGNPLAMAAGCVMLDLASQQGFTEAIEKHTAELCTHIRESCAQASVPARVNQAGSMWTLFLAEGEVFDYATAKKANVQRFAALHHALLE